jgi:hypothetical protein
MKDGVDLPFRSMNIFPDGAAKAGFAADTAGAPIVAGKVGRTEQCLDDGARDGMQIKLT